MRKRWILCLMLFLWGSNSAPAINTHKKWDGHQFAPYFGCPDTTTYGQVIKMNERQLTLGKFSFWWANASTGSLVVRGEVYAWDEDHFKATGNALYESEPREISFNDGAFHKVTFDTGGIPVSTRTRYVLFASIDKDYDQCVDDYILGWGVLDNVYRRGEFVYQNNHGNADAWTTEVWNDASDRDLAFTTFQNP